jgi:uroporphyrinogen-III synthase
MIPFWVGDSTAELLRQRKQKKAAIPKSDDRGMVTTWSREKKEEAVRGATDMNTIDRRQAPP